MFETLSGNQRMRVLRELGVSTVHCVVVDLDDANAKLLAQALNRIQGIDDLGVKAKVVKSILQSIPHTDVLSLLPETRQSLDALSSLGQMDLAKHLTSWQRARSGRLNHMIVQLTDRQLDTVRKAMHLALEGQPKPNDAPNERGHAIWVICQAYLDFMETRQ